jgi:tricorn protease
LQWFFPQNENFFYYFYVTLFLPELSAYHHMNCSIQVLVNGKNNHALRDPGGKNMTKLTLVASILILMATIGFAKGDGVYFAQTPTISPDAQKIVFSYEKDLWMVNATGGTAYRLTGMEGIEAHPRFSPDGKWIAFSSTQEGNGNVYVMPATGGEIKQLTFHDSGDVVDSWSWDSKYIYFTSGRYNNFSEYRISIAGGTPIRLFEHYFNTVHGVVEHPQSGALYFTDTWESFRFASRKRYKGDYNPDIKSYNPKTKEFKVHTSYRGKDFFPSIDKQGNLYFISDRLNGQYNLYQLKGQEKVKLTSFDTSIKTPLVSANGQIVVFIKDYQLYTYNVASKKSQKVPVKLFQNDSLTLEKGFNISGKISAFDVSPDGKKITFVSRGELFVSDIKGKFIRHIETAADGRVIEVLWLKDNKTLIFNQTLDGWQNLFKVRSDIHEKEQKLTTDTVNNRNIALDSERKQMLYLSGATKLKVMDLKSFKSKTVVQEELWGFYNSQPYFSPDDRFIVFTAIRNFEEDILVHELANGKTINLTDSGISESAPFWSPDGKYLYFSSGRYAPSYPRGGRSDKIYRLPLHKFAKPFRSAKYTELFKEKKKDKDDSKGKGKKGDKDKAKKKEEKKKKVKVTFDLSEMARRWEQISPRSGRQGRPYVTQIKEDTYVIYSSNHDGESSGLWITTLNPFEKAKTKKVKGAKFGYNIVAAKDKYYALVRGSINELNLKGHAMKPIKMSYKFRRNLRAEFDQMFYELWAGVQENFYDHKFHGIDWLKIRNQYAKLLPYVTSRADFRVLVADMLGELNASHLGLYSSGKEEKIYHSMRTMATGLYFDKDDPYLVKEVLKESPADKKGIDIKPGDRITAINGKPVDKKMNREFYFRGPATDDEIKLTIQRKETTFTVKLHPSSSYPFRLNLYDQWTRDNQNQVDKKSKKRIAYIHMKNMGGNSLNNFIVEMTNETYHRDALILDLRYNTGGNVHNDVLNFLSQKPYSYWKYRGGKYANQPHFAPAAKPIVLLINEQTLSDGEVTAEGFKALKLGTVIGTETYRWIIFTSGKGLVDGSFYRLPSWGCYSLDKKDLELTGVKPDIYIKNTVKDRLEGKDPQLDAAINHIMKQLK